MIKDRVKKSYSKGTMVKRILWNICWTILIRPFPRLTARKWTIFVYKLFGAQIGAKSGIHSSAYVLMPWNLVMGEGACIADHTIVSNNRPLFIGKRAVLSQYSTVYCGSHNVFSDEFESEGAPVIIEDHSWVAAHSYVGAGVTIGRGARVGAASAVRKDVPPYSISYGNPNQIVAFRKRPEEIIEYEKERYEESERLPLDILKKNYEAFYGKPKTEKVQIDEEHIFSIDDYIQVFHRVFPLATENVYSFTYKGTDGWDSVGHMSLIVEMENTFDITLKPEDFLLFHSYEKGLEILKEYGITFEENKTEVFIPEEFLDFSAFQDLVAVQTEDEAYTYRQLDEKAQKFASILKRGKVAFLLAKNTIGSIACYVGCIKNNVPVAVLDAHKDSDFIGNIIKHYHPEYLLLPTEDVAKYDGVMIGQMDDYSVLHVEETNYPVSDDLALLLTTSGSTGSPKFVRLTKKNIKSNAESIVQYLGLTSQERPITSLPMYYSYGISIINSHFAVGATLILTEESIVSPSFWQLAKNSKATSVSGVPYTYDMFKQMRVMDMDIPSLKTFTQAGGKMTKENVTFFAEKCKQNGKKLIVMYGQTEAAPRISYLPFDKAEEKSDSIGIPIPGVDLSISEDSELICTGDNVFQGYAESYKDLGKGDEIHGVLYTGDMARRDEDGFFYITGRKKRFVKVYGNRVGLDELEQLIAPEFGKVVCVGVDDHVTIYTENNNLDLSALVSFISEKSKINSNAFRAACVDSFYYSETGKIEYRKFKVLL